MTTAPVSGTVCTRDMTTSPVPGGRSTSRKSKLAPLHLLQKLANDLVQHRAAHDQRLIAGGNESDRNKFDPMGHQGLDLVVLEHPRLLADAHHERNVGSIDVRVDETDAKAHLDQCRGQIDSERGLAHSTFTRTDSDDVRHTWQSLRPWRRLRMCHINPLLRACVRGLFALALVLALFAAPSCVLVAAFLFFRLRLQWWNPHAASLAGRPRRR